MDKEDNAPKSAAADKPGKYLTDIEDLRGVLTAYIHEFRTATEELQAKQEQLVIENKQWRESLLAENKQWQENLLAESKQWRESLLAENKERDAKNEELEQHIKELKRHVAGMNNTMGLIAEDIFRRDFMRLMKKAGVRLDAVETRVRRKNHERECDIIGFNRDTVVLCEVKARLRQGTVEGMDDRIATFREDFPDYARPKLYVAVAGLSVDQPAADLACGKGFFILVGRGASLSPQHPKNFIPRAY